MANTATSALLYRHTQPADLVALSKPGILVFALMTEAGALSLAPAAVSLTTWMALLLGTGLIVAAANASNMYLERDIDCHMARTMKRPLPAGRMHPHIALAFAGLCLCASLPILSFGVNALTGLLGFIAFISYVFWYTPLKQRSTMATIVGSLPGAMPALMGWTAATGAIEMGGLVIFGVLFVWQIPHFHAISMFRSKEYSRAGLKVLPVETSTHTTRLAILAYTAVQVQLSLMLYPLGVAGLYYTLTAALLGAAYFGYAAYGLISAGGAKWGKKFFLFSIVYLPILFTVMVIDGL